MVYVEFNGNNFGHKSNTVAATGSRDIRAENVNYHANAPAITSHINSGHHGHRSSCGASCPFKQTCAVAAVEVGHECQQAGICHKRFGFLIAILNR